MEDAIGRLKELSGKRFVKLTERGNAAIKSALSLAKRLGKKKVIIQDQGGWMTYRQFSDELGLEVVEVKTDYGLIDLHDLISKAEDNSVLIAHSMPGYLALDDAKGISDICMKNNCMYMNDVSGSIGTDAAKYGDIVFGSFGRWKPLNLGYGGFIATGEKKIFDMIECAEFDSSKIPELLRKIDSLGARLKYLRDARKKVVKDLSGYDIIHKEGRGLNVAVRFSGGKAKQELIDYCNNEKLEFVECPKYIRVNEKAISIEVKRL